MIIEYSPEERNLIKSLNSSYESLMEMENIFPKTLYEILGMECFMKNKSGANVDALRNVCHAIRDCKPYRMTEEFNQLCRF